MAAGIGALIVSLGLDAAEFVAGLTKADNQARAFAQNVQQVGAEFGTAIGVGAGVAGAAIVAMTTSAINAADHLNDLSQSAGISVETLGGIGFAAGQAGSDLDTAAAAAGKLNKSLADAAAGNKEAGEAFRVLGLNVKDVAGNTKGADVVLVELANKFAGFADGPEKSALAVRTFGKAGADLIPLLNEGGEALQENIAFFKEFSGVTTQTSEDADAFNDVLGKMGVISASVGAKLAGELLPALQAVAEAALQAGRDSTSLGSILSTVVRTGFEAVVVLASDVAFTFGAVGREIGAAAAQLALFASLRITPEGLTAFGAGWTAISDAVKADGVRARKELDAFEARVLQTGKAAADALRRVEDRGFTPTSSNKPSAPRLPGGGGSAAAISEAERYLENLRKQLQATKDLSVEQTLLAEIEVGSLGKVGPELEKKLLAYARQIDAAKHLDAVIKAQKGQEAENDAFVRKSAAEALRLADAYDTLRASVLAASGDEVGAAAIRNAAAMKEATDLVKKAGGDPAIAQQYGAQLTALTALTQARKEYDALLTQQQATEANILLDAQISGAGELEVLAALRDARAVAIVQLRDQAAAAALVAAAAGSNDEQRKFAADLALSAKTAQSVLDPLAARFKSTFTDAFAGAFVGFVTGTKTAKEAFKDFAASVISEMANMAAKELALSLFKNTGTGGGGSGWGSFLSSVAGWFSGSGGTKMASGTNFVPYDGFKASLHRGEAVVPAAYNVAAGRAAPAVINVTNTAGEVAQASARQNDDGSIEVLIRRVEASIAANVGRGRGPLWQGLRGRGVNLNGSLARVG